MISLHPPKEKTGTRSPLGPRRRNGMPLGSYSRWTGQSCRGVVIVIVRSRTQVWLHVVVERGKERPSSFGARVFWSSCDQWRIQSRSWPLKRGLGGNYSDAAGLRDDNESGRIASAALRLEKPCKKSTWFSNKVTVSNEVSTANFYALSDSHTLQLSVDVIDICHRSNVFEWESSVLVKFGWRWKTAQNGSLGLGHGGSNTRSNLDLFPTFGNHSKAISTVPLLLNLHFDYTWASTLTLNVTLVLFTARAGLYYRLVERNSPIFGIWTPP